MGPLREVVVGEVVPFLTAYLGYIRDSLSNSYKHHLQCVASSCCVTFSRTYAFCSDVPPILDERMIY